MGTREEYARWLRHARVLLHRGGLGPCLRQAEAIPAFVEDGVSSVRALREKEREERLNQARDFAEAVAHALGPLTAWVYGSVARGDFHFASDIDVLLVAPNLPPSPLKRLELLYRFVTPGIEPKAYTPEEFGRFLAAGSPGSGHA